MSFGKPFYLVNEKPYYLTKMDTTRLVVPAKNHHLLHVASRLADSTRLGIDTKVPNNFLVVRGDANKLEEVPKYEDVFCTRSAFTTADGFELVLTNDILVKFAPSMSVEERQRICEKLNCVLVENNDESASLIRVLDPHEDAPLDIANKLYEEKNVEYAEPNMLQAAKYASITPPQDSLFVNQWHLHNTGQGGGKVGADVNALKAWEITQGSPNISVVVHDSGVDVTHPDLIANINPGWDFDNNDPDASPELISKHASRELISKHAHGTACAGVIVGALNGKGIVGIAPKCKITPIRAAGALDWNTWAETFKWAAKHGDIISCSWSIAPNNTLAEAIAKAATQGRNGKGIPIFFATGNDGIDSISFPASVKETIAVGASTNIDVVSEYSQYGQGIDFVAPSSPCNSSRFPCKPPAGDNGTLRIETTDIRGEFGYNSNAGSEGDYCHGNDNTGFGGTSSATPLAAGVGALLLSVNPNLTAEQVRTIMRESAIKIDSANANYDENGWSEKYGYGRIDAEKAVKMAQTM
ncbi:S8 family serine peptidase [Bacillus cereus]|nr:S8 family serine peptidase [Bacillus cereus]